MKRLFFNIFLILVFLVAIDQVSGYVLDLIRDNSPDGRYYKIKYSLDSCREDMVIIGSSRGEIDFIPKILEDSLGFTCWNASRGGQGTPYFRSIQEGILKRYVPKIVILNVDDNDLELAPDYERAGVLKPFYSSNPEIRPILNRTSRFESILLRSRLYEYNSSFYYLIRPYFFPGLDGRKQDKGWKPREGKMHAELEDKIRVVKGTGKIEPESKMMFDSFIKRFTEKGSLVIMVVPPNYDVLEDSSTVLQYLRGISLQHEIPLVIYSNNMNFITRPDFYVDPDHLNVVGAETFTKNLVQRIRPFIEHRYGVPGKHDLSNHRVLNK